MTPPPTPYAREVEKTTDGVPFAVGMTVYWRSKDPRTAEGVVVSRIDEAGDPHCVIDGEEWLVPVEWASSKPVSEVEAATDELLRWLDTKAALAPLAMDPHWHEFGRRLAEAAARIRSDAAKLRKQQAWMDERIAVLMQSIEPKYYLKLPPRDGFVGSVQNALVSMEKKIKEQQAVIESARKFIASEYSTMNDEGEAIPDPIARRIHDKLCDALAALTEKEPT